jgi:hypothetical protein
MSDHRYKIGQKVMLLTAKRLRAPHGSYHVVERLPAQNGEPRYLVRSSEQDHDKTIADESDLGNLLTKFS